MNTQEQMLLTSPFTMIVAGASQSGKTVFTKNLLLHLNQLVDKCPEIIIISYGDSCKQYEDLKGKIENLRFRQGLSFDVPENSLIVIDDQMSSVVASGKIADLFIQKVHSRNISIILLQQNLFPQGKFGRDIRLNTHYFVIFKSPTFLSQINYLQRTLFPQYKSFLVDAYTDATKNPYSYLFLSLHARSNDLLRVRSEVLPGEDQIVYLPKQK